MTPSESGTHASEKTPARNRFVAQECFVFDISSQKETRVWSEIPVFKPIPELIRNRQFEEAWALLDQHQDDYTDFDFIYVWQSVILQKNNQIQAAKEAVRDGLKQAKSKYVLCDRMGHIAYAAQDISGAIKWWFRSIVLMIKEQQLTMWEPFLYLAYVARGLGNKSAFKQLMNQVEQISVHGELQLETTAEQKLYQRLKTIDAAPVQEAFDLLEDLMCNNTACQQSLKTPVAPEKEKQPFKPVNQEHRIPRVSPRNIPVWVWGVLAGVIVLGLLGIFLFGRDPAPEKVSQPAQPTQYSPPLQVEPHPPVGVPQKKTVKPMENQRSEIKDPVETRQVIQAPPPPATVPNKEKQKWLKVKTKTPLPGIKKKPGESGLKIETEE